MESLYERLQHLEIGADTVEDEKRPGGPRVASSASDAQYLAIDLDEADLESLVELEPGDAPARELPPDAITRPRLGEGGRDGADADATDLFDAPGSDLSQYHDDGEPPRGDS